MIVLVPSTIALLSAYSGIEDPVSELRAACRGALRALVATDPPRVAVVAAPPRAENVVRGVLESAGWRIARELLADVGFSGPVVDGPVVERAVVEGPAVERAVVEGAADAGAVLVVANGSARRSEKAPGHLDHRAAAFDESLEQALRRGDGAALQALNPGLAEELWCFDAPAWQLLGALVLGRAGEVTYAGDPYGVQYWVATW